MHTISTENYCYISGGDFIPIADGWWADDAAIAWGAAALGVAYLANGSHHHKYSIGGYAKAVAYSAIYMGAIVLTTEAAWSAFNNRG
jgi:hypothetical protein